MARTLHGLVIYSYLKDGTFTAVKRDATFFTGMRKGYHLSTEGKRKRHVFCQKCYTVKGLFTWRWWTPDR